MGRQYLYQVEFNLFCVPLFAACGFELLQGPPGAGIDSVRGVVFWDPVAGTSQFSIATKPDACGNRANQSWTVSVQ